MALLRWIHLRKLVPLDRSDRADAADAAPASASASRPRRDAGQAPRAAPATRRADGGRAAVVRRSKPKRAATAAGRPRRPSRRQLRRQHRAAGDARAGATFKDAFLAEIRKSKKFVLQHGRRAGAEDRRRAGDRVVFVFAPAQRALRDAVRAEPRVARVDRAASSPAARWRSSPPQAQPAQPPAPRTRRRSRRRRAPDRQQAALKQQALADAGVQALLEVFPRRSGTSRRCSG